MAHTSTTVQLGKRTLELSNLNRVLFPEDKIVKAELIQYYLTIGPTILSHISGRPLSLVRFPDGIAGEHFYQKNKPEWAPEWLEYAALGKSDERKQYILANEPASLVWLANLACIEFHQMNSRVPNFGRPDYFVVDLDPPETSTFDDVIGVAFSLKEHIETFGYHPFVKTSGKKGLHIVVPILPRWNVEAVLQAAVDLAKTYVALHEETTTLHLNKSRRKGRILLDIYRNRTHQSIVSPYSVRGVRGATISTPVTWEELAHVKSSSDFTIANVPDRVRRQGDPWEAMGAFAEPLHTEKRRVMKRPLPPSRRRKTPAALKKYQAIRNPVRTPEPMPRGTMGEGNAFVVHRHHASRLHYDLRLEQDGTLKSWAVPKGLPPRPHIKRLAVATEDHPLEYLDFEGAIPKGEYGGGSMWVFARGRYQVTKEKKNGLYFRLQSKELNGEYRTHKTKDNEWLLERIDTPQIDWLRDPIEPMLASSAEQPPQSDHYLFEVKWDGIRALIVLDEGAITIRTRNMLDVTARFPELLVPEQAFRATSALFDAEIVCLDRAGKPVFRNVIRRLQQTSASAIKRAQATYPAVCYVFDCLFLDGRPIVQEPLERRRVWTADAIKPNAFYRFSEAMEDGEALFKASRAMGLEGIMAKERSSTYLPGQRTSQWVKVKTRNTTECLIIGYTQGRGRRQSDFGALHLAQRNGTGLRYVGKVGTGLHDATVKDLYARLKSLQRIKRPVNEKPVDDATSVWVEPKLRCEVQYSSWTKAGMLREAVFLRARPDLDEVFA